MSEAGLPSKATATAGGGGYARMPYPPTAQGGKNSQLERLLLRIVDGGLAGCIFVVPLLMGGRQALGQFVLVFLAVSVALAWTLGQCLRRESFWRHSSAELLLGAGVVLLVVQLAPLPQSMLAWMAPHTAEVLPLWTAQGDPSAQLGTWSCVSMTPGATRAGLSLFLAYGLLFLVTVQRIRVVEDIERLLRWLALSALLMASFGLVQLLTSNGKFFWFYEHPFSNTFGVAKGSFTNRNHFAHFLALGIGPLIWWLQHNLGNRPKHRQIAFSRLIRAFHTRKHAWGFRSVVLGIVLFAGLLSLSRGGVLVMFVAAAICVAVCYRAKTLGVRFVLSLAGVALLIGALLTIHGYERVSNRLDDLSSGSLEQLDRGGGRRTIWATVAKAIPDYALLGAGVGSHREVYPMYLENPPETEFTHAENGYLQQGLETGLVGLSLVLAGIGLCGFWCVGSLRSANSGRMLVCAAAIFASLVVSVAHSLVDFVWHVPACMAVVALLAGCACRIRQLAAEARGKQLRPVAVPSYVGLAMVLVLTIVGTWMVTSRIGPTLADPHWGRYQILALASSRPGPAKENQQTAFPSGGHLRYPPDGRPDQVREASREVLTRMISELEQVVAQNPDHARAHLRLAAAYLRRFDLAQQASENVMPLAQIRDAATQARLASSDDVVEEWLSRALGSRRRYLDLALQHTRRGLALCPLQGEGYLYLAELCFLEGAASNQQSRGAAKAAYIDQALKVRAFDGAVLFEAGREAWLAGDFQQGVAYWQRSFRSGRIHQRQLIELLAGRAPLAFLLENFPFDLHAMRVLHAHYRNLNQPDQLDELRQSYARAASVEAQGLEGEEAAATWSEARRLYHLLGETDHALQCAQNAFQCDPNNYHVRYGLALCLVEQNQFAEAERHLNWCLQRQPNNQKLQRMTREVVKKRIDNEGRSALIGNKPSVSFDLI